MSIPMIDPPARIPLVKRWKLAINVMPGAVLDAAAVESCFCGHNDADHHPGAAASRAVTP